MLGRSQVLRNAGSTSSLVPKSIVETNPIVRLQNFGKNHNLARHYSTSQNHRAYMKCNEAFSKISPNLGKVYLAMCPCTRFPQGTSCKVRLQRQRLLRYHKLSLQGHAVQDLCIGILDIGCLYGGRIYRGPIYKGPI